MGSGFWSIATILGPLILIAVIIRAVLRNRTTPEEDARTERGTRELYDQLDAEEKEREHNAAAD